VLFVIVTAISCSTSKNTSMSVAYHNLTAHYNVYFNANENLKSGIRKLQKSEEDYSKLLPVFKYEDLNSSGIVSSDMDMAITKCAKTIKSHSITAKPKMNAKGLSQKEREFMSKPEYCKWIDDAYFIMGEAHFYKKEFETALQTFLLNINKYSKESSFDEAKLWLAKTYVETKDYKNAENTLVELRKDKRWDQYFSREIDLLYASMYLKQKNYDMAAQKLITVLGYKQKKKEKPRLQFILAQIYQNNNQYALAIDNYKKVIKKNPNYDISFKSKINLAEIYEKNGANASDLKGQFLKMLKDEKNVDYRDQLYYALAKIEQNQKNTAKAIEYYKLSARSKSSNKTQKVKTFLALADFYFTKENYGLAEAYYDSTLSKIEPTFPDYETVNPQIKSRKALSQNLNMVYMEDSLQAIAKLPETERNGKIDAIIQNIRLEEQKALEANQNQKMDLNPMDDNNQSRVTESGTGSNYYFYNANSVSYGQTEFKKKWGDRKLEDNWRRSNKQMVSDLSQNQDSVENKGTGVDVSKEKKVTDKKTREYYLQNLPLNQEKLEASNKKIEKALLNSGNLYQKDFNDNQKAIWQYEKLLSRFPKTDSRLEALQKTHKLYLAELNNDMADKYKQMIVKEFPDCMYAKMLTDPAYVQKVKKEEAEIEKLYQTAYDRYIKKEFTESIGYCEHSLKTYPDNYLSAKFIFLKAVAYGETGNKPMLKENLESVIQKYPNEEVATRARAMLDIMAGRKFEEKLYVSSKDSIHYYVLVYPKDKIDLNKLKFKFVSFNAKFFTQEDYQVIVQSLDNSRDNLLVQSFKNSKLATVYFQKIISEGLLKEYATFAPNHFVISSNNYQVYLRSKDDEKYLKFFDEEYLKN
jgi:tetratricopeptide (TPR) repeat protein